MSPTLAMITFIISLLLVPISALLFMWAWSLFAPIFGLPALDFFPSLGIVLAARLVFPANTISAYGAT